MVDLDGRFPVMLTFDVDGETLWLNHDAKSAQRPVTLSAGRYGPETGVFKILRLLDRYGIRATFFVPGWIADHHPETLRAIDAAGHEIGHHGYLHEWPDRMAPEDEEPILLKGIRAIEQVTGHRPVGYRAPAWEFTPRTLGLLEQHGFLYSSNMMDADGPYRHPGIGERTGLIEFPVEWMLDDSSMYLYSLRLPGGKLMPNEQVLSMWCGEFDGLYRDGSSCVLTLHPQLTGRSYRLMALDQFIRHALGRPRVSFVRCVDAAEYLQRVL